MSIKRLPFNSDTRIHEFCRECSTYLFRDWHSGNYDCRFADVCKKRKEHFKSQDTIPAQSPTFHAGGQ